MINLIRRKGINPQTRTTIYYPAWTRKETIDGAKLAKRMKSSTYSVGEILGVMQDFPEKIVDELIDGNAVKIDGLGQFKLKVSGKAKATADEVSSRGCTVSVVFEPDAQLTARLQAEQQFQFVAVPTAEGQQDVADDDQPGGTSDAGGGTNEGNGGSEQGGENGGGVNPNDGSME